MILPQKFLFREELMILQRLERKILWYTVLGIASLGLRTLMKTEKAMLFIKKEGISNRD